MRQENTAMVAIPCLKLRVCGLALLLLLVSCQSPAVFSLPTPTSLLVPSSTPGSVTAHTPTKPATPMPSPTVGASATATPTTLVSATATPTTLASAMPTPTTLASTQPSPSLVATVLALVNAERAAAGCEALTLDETLMQVALSHSEDMAAHRILAHEGSDGRTPAQRLLDAGYQFQLMAENVAAGYPTAESVVQGWIESPEHRANLLNCELRETGIGAVEAPGDATYGIYWTQLFATPLEGQ